jgi:hypothetical protein
MTQNMRICRPTTGCRRHENKCGHCCNASGQPATKCAGAGNNTHTLRAHTPSMEAGLTQSAAHTDTWTAKQSTGLARQAQMLPSQRTSRGRAPPACPLPHSSCCVRQAATAHTPQPTHEKHNGKRKGGKNSRNSPHRHTHNPAAQLKTHTPGHPLYTCQPSEHTRTKLRVQEAGNLPHTRSS